VQHHTIEVRLLALDGEVLERRPNRLVDLVGQRSVQVVWCEVILAARSSEFRLELKLLVSQVQVIVMVICEAYE
jgi:hypothetical protein